MLEDGYNVDFYEIGAIPHDSDSHQIQKKVLEQMEAQFLMEFPEEEYDVIVDAVFGVGLKRESSWTAQRSDRENESEESVKSSG